MVQIKPLTGHKVRSLLRFLVKRTAMNMLEGSAIKPLHKARELPKDFTRGIVES